MAAQVLIEGGNQPGRGLGPHLSGIAAPVSVQENSGKAGLDYQGGNNKRQSNQRIHQSRIKTTLDQYFIKGGIAMIDDETPSQSKWVYATKKGLTNWIAENSTNKESPQDGNTILMCEDPSQPNKPVKDEHAKVEALVEMERWIGQEKSKFQPLVEELEGINLKDETKRKEV
ncbi:hypothetical protein CR513_10911, partial [Mucuna pruriens]